MSDTSFSNARGLRLAARLREASRDKLVVFAHGFTSDKSCRGRFDYLSECLNKRGYSTLAFDFAGCGASEDADLSIAREVEDLLAAAAYGRSLGYERISLWGHSLGSRVCLQANPPDIRTMVLTGAGTGPMKYDWGTYFSAANMEELRVTGKVTLTLTEGPRAAIMIPRDMLQEFEEFDQAQVLAALRRPVLIIHGDADEEERALSALSERALQYLPAGSRIEIVSGASHSFHGYLDTLLALGAAWLDRHQD